MPLTDEPVDPSLLYVGAMVVLACGYEQPRRRIGLRGWEATIEIPEGWQPRLVKALGAETLGGRRVQVWAELPSDSGAGGEGHFEQLARLERTVGTL